MKKILSILLAVMMLLSAMPVMAEGEPEHVHTWKVDEEDTKLNDAKTEFNVIVDCADCGEHYGLIFGCEAVPEVTQAGTCVLPELTKYTATNTITIDGQDVAVAIEETIETKAATGHDGYCGDEVTTGNCLSYEAHAVVVSEPTCTEKGEAEYPCFTCATPHTFKMDIPALGHVAKEGTDSEITKEPTCTEDGIRHYDECANAPADAPHGFDEVVKAEHKWVKVQVDGKDVVVAPTCTEDGYTEYVCEICEETMKGDIQSKLGHAWIKNDGTLTTDATDPDIKLFVEQDAPHCDMTGMDVEFTMCGREGCFHKNIIKTSSNYWTVKSHQEWLNDFVKYDAEKDDIWDVYNKIYDAATVEIEGEWYIPEMDAVIVPENENATTPTPEYVGKYHPVHVESVAPTCTEAGSITLTCTGCEQGEDNCGAKVVLTIPAHGHAFYPVEGEGYDYDVRFETDENGNEIYEVCIPDCTKGGKLLIACLYCDITPEQVQFPSAGGHVYKISLDDGEVVVTNWRYSQKNNFGAPIEETRDFSEIAECNDYTIHKYCLGHTTTLGNAYEVELLVNGVVHTISLNIACGNETTEKVAGDGKHTSSNDNYAYEAPTCYAEGYEYYNCAKCGFPAGGKLDKIDHNLKVTTDVKPTCTTEGLIVYDCQVEKCDYVSEQVVPATGHKLIAGEGKAATCTTDGYVRETCIYCGENFDTVIPAGHTVPENFFEMEQNEENGFAYKAATCTKDGSISFQCEVCHKYVYNQKIPALGHTYERKTYIGNVMYDGEMYDGYIPATCQREPYYYRVCQDDKCDKKDASLKILTINDGKYEEVKGKFFEKVIVGDKLGHLLAAYNESTKEGVTYEKVISSLVFQKLPTCEETGLAYYNCAVCETLVKDFVLPKLPHNEVITWNKEESKFEVTCGKLYLDSNSQYVQDLYDTEWLYAEIAACTEDEDLAVEIWSNVVDEVMTKLIDTDKDGTFLKGIGCDAVIKEIKVNKTHYDIDFDSVSNTVVLTPDENIALLKNAYVIVNWDYTLSDDTIFSYTRSFEETEAGSLTYKLGLAKTPAGAVLNAVTIIVTDDANSIEITEAAKGFGIEQF